MPYDRADNKAHSKNKIENIEIFEDVGLIPYIHLEIALFSTLARTDGD